MTAPLLMGELITLFTTNYNYTCMMFHTNRSILYSVVTVHTFKSYVLQILLDKTSVYNDFRTELLSDHSLTSMDVQFLRPMKHHWS